MPTTDDTKYRLARDAAQALANASGYDYGLERNAFGWSAFMLPMRKNRYGHELRCEVVHPERLDACKPGHGPCA
jgi:hypothetical protein